MKNQFCLLLPMALLAGCLRTEAAPVAGPAENPSETQANETPRKLEKLLVKMQAADAIADPVRRCIDYPSPPGITWSAASIKARCELLAPTPKFIGEGLNALSASRGAEILDAGFKALLDDTESTPASRDDRMFRVLGSFSTPAALPYAEKWLAGSPDSPFAHAAKGAGMLARAIRTRGGAFAAETDPDDLDTTEAQATVAANELRQAYALEPRLSAACALLTTALTLSDGSRAAIRQGRDCAHAHPASYFAASAWASAAEPRWGGSRTELAEVSAFLAANQSGNPLMGSVAGKVAAYDLLTTRETLGIDDIRRLEAHASAGPQSYMLNGIAEAWEELGNTELWMVYLSSAVRFDIDADQYRQTRAWVNLARRPEWALVDYRLLKEKRPAEPGYDDLIEQAERNLANGTGTTFAREGQVTIEGDSLRKVMLTSECLSQGTSDRKLDPVMETCSDTLISEWPEDPTSWFVRARMLQHRDPGDPEWQVAARNFLMLADDGHAGEAQRIKLIQALLDEAQATPAGGSSSP